MVDGGPPGCLNLVFGCCGWHGGRVRLGLLLSGASVGALILQADRNLLGLKNIKMPKSPSDQPADAQGSS